MHEDEKQNIQDGGFSWDGEHTWERYAEGYVLHDNFYFLSWVGVSCIL